MNECRKPMSSKIDLGQHVLRNFVENSKSVNMIVVFGLGTLFF